MDVKLLHRQGVSIRGIARRTGLSRATVRGILKQVAPKRYGLKADGSIVAWGYQGVGACDVPEPNTGFVVVAAGASHGLGVKEDGSIVAWGFNNYGQCDVPEPNANFVAVSGGAYHSLGVRVDGTVEA
jgi:alpha-tubulin suppressor-like RCC1 family protein